MAAPTTFLCSWCNDECPDPPFASCAACAGNLCERCFKTHTRIPQPPRLAGHVAVETQEETPVRVALLGTLGLAPPAKTCPEHALHLLFVCASHENAAPTLLCADCVEAHHGHSLISLKKSSAEVKDRLRSAAEGGLAQVMERARLVSRQASVDLGVLPVQRSAVRDAIVAARDAILLAVTDRVAVLDASADAAAARGSAAISQRLKSADALVESVAAMRATIAQAVAAFDDVDIITHGATLLALAQDVVSEVDALAAEPAVPPFLALALGPALGEATDAIERLGAVAASPAEEAAAAALAATARAADRAAAEAAEIRAAAAEARAATAEARAAAAEKSASAALARAAAAERALSSTHALLAHEVSRATAEQHALFNRVGLQHLLQPDAHARNPSNDQPELVPASTDQQVWGGMKGWAMSMEAWRMRCGATGAGSDEGCAVTLPVL